MGVKLGMDAKLYYDAAGAEQGSWTEQDNVKDLTINLETGEADVSVRGSGGWRLSRATLKDGSVEFEMVWDDADAGFTAIQTAYFTNTPIGLAIMDGDILTIGSQGLIADFSIINFSRNEPLEEAITVNVTAKPTKTAFTPKWETVSV